MPAELVAALAVFAFVTSITPGPNNALLLTSGVNHGFRATVPHMLGISIGFSVMLLAVGFGLGQALGSFPAFYQVLRVASVAYMLWLAWKIASAPPPAAGDGAARSRPMTFLQAAAFQWVNPKAWSMCLTAVPAYSLPNRFTFTMAVMAAVFAMVNLPCIAVWTGFGVSLRRLLQDWRRVRIFNVVMALLLVVSLWPMISDLVGR